MIPRPEGRSVHSWGAAGTATPPSPYPGEITCQVESSLISIFGESEMLFTYKNLGEDSEKFCITFNGILRGGEVQKKLMIKPN